MNFMLNNPTCNKTPGRPKLEKILLMFISTAILTVLLNCDDYVSTGQPPTNGDLIPLKEGNWWFYNYEEFLNDTLVNEQTDSIVIHSTIVYKDEKWFGYNGAVGYYETYFMKNESDGLHILIFQANDATNPRNELYFKYPASEGDIWVAEYPMEVVSLLSTVSVPSGDFNHCIKYKFIALSKTPYDQFYIWVKPGVGEVQRMGIKSDSTKTIKTVWKLKDYFIEWE